jgi:uncharacterized delta-60 repeat protein
MQAGPPRARRRSAQVALAAGALLAALVAGNALAAAGQLDASFSGDGRVLTRFPGATGNDQAFGTAIQNGKVVVAGTSVQAGGVGEFAVARYNPNGSLDKTFSGDGRVLTQFPGSTNLGDTARAVAIENGKIVVAGYSEQPAFVDKFAVARYNPNGSLDTTFSGDGRVLTRFPGATGGDEAYAMAIENGKIVVGGTSGQAAGREFALARFNPNGSLDSSFSGDGRKVNRLPGATGDDEVLGLAIESGKIVAAGGSQQAGGIIEFAVARYNPNGSLDKTFSSDGRRLTHFPGATADEVARGVTTESGKIVVVGWSAQAAGRKFALARLNPNGSLDSSFSGDGRQLTRFPGTAGDDEADGVTTENGNIVVAGTSKQGTSTYKFALARYRPSGSLDSSFSGDGRQLTRFPGTTGNDDANAVTIENSRIVVAGTSHQTAGYKFAVARYLAS